MKIAVDSYYYSDTDCYTVGVIFENWTDSEPVEIISCHTSRFGPYIPGQFYLRELPGLERLLASVDLSSIDTVIVDGFVNFGDQHPGLGEHLKKDYLDQINPSINIVGVAKTKFSGCEKFSEPVLRGKAINPLWVQGTNPENIKNMDGKYRLPTLLKILDKETKKYKK